MLVPVEEHKGRVMNLERIFVVEPAFHKKNHGIHCAELRMVVKGDRGAVQFVLFTGWYLPHSSVADTKPLPADLGWHSPKPMYKGQSPVRQSCEYLDGKPCYYDGTSLGAQDVFNLLISEGSDAVWTLLENRYHELFSESGDV